MALQIAGFEGYKCGFPLCESMDIDVIVLQIGHHEVVLG
jgi:hypothetical protein